MKLDKIVTALSALAQESRLAVYVALTEAESGLAAGAISSQLEIPATTLSFHLSQLKNAGLVQSTKDGRNIIYTANTKRAKRVAQYLTGKRREKEQEFEI